MGVSKHADSVEMSARTGGKKAVVGIGGGCVAHGNASWPGELKLLVGMVGRVDCLINRYIADTLGDDDRR